jgi:hypothetical protein
LRNSSRASASSTLPRYIASQPHGCSTTSISTANGIVAVPAKYQASAGTSYSAVTLVPVRMPPYGPSTATIRDITWYGGPG